MKGRGKKKLRGKGGWNNLPQRYDLHCTRYKMNGSRETSNCRVSWDKIKEDRGKNSEPVEGKAPVLLK
jgi:hypothetical protein